MNSKQCSDGDYGDAEHAKSEGRSGPSSISAANASAQIPLDDVLSLLESARYQVGQSHSVDHSRLESAEESISKAMILLSERRQKNEEKITGVFLVGGYRDDEKVRALIVGEPADGSDHNCDVMGCPSVGPHGLYYVPIRVQGNERVVPASGSGASQIEIDKLKAEIKELKARLNEPDPRDFILATEIEIRYQRSRWAAEGDTGKTDADWFWLIGYLAGKALHNPGGDEKKRLHRITTIAAAAGNWHAAITGAYTDMRPGIDEAALESAKT